MTALQKLASSKDYSLSDLGRARDLDGASGPLDVTDWTEGQGQPIMVQPAFSLFGGGAMPMGQAV